MSIQSNMSKRFETMDRNSQRMCWLLDMHGIELNWPEGLPAFVHKLETDRHLAMDFWALIRSLRRLDTTHLGNQQIAALIVSCVCGSNPVPWGHEDKVALTHLTSMLSTSDASSDPNANLPSALVVSEKTKSSAMTPEGSHTSEGEPEQPLIGQNRRVADDIPTSQDLSRHLDETLSRLELTTLELKVHLDNLDSRMSRIEPHLEDITSLVSSTFTPPPPNGSKYTAPLPEVPSPNASTPVHSPEPDTVVMNDVVPKAFPEPEISWRDKASEWWIDGTFAHWPDKVKTVWANKPHWKLPPHLLTSLRQRWLNSKQFLTTRLQNTHRRHIAVVASLFIVVLATSAIIMSAHRHTSNGHTAQPHQVKATEPSVGAPDNADTPAATSSTISQPKVQPGTAATITEQPDNQKKKRTDDYTAKPTFKWLGEGPDPTQRKQGDKTSTNPAPRAAVLGEKATAPAARAVGIDTRPVETSSSQ